MNICRRTILAGAAALSVAPVVSKLAFAVEAGRSLPIPPILEASRSPVNLDAIHGTTSFSTGQQTRTLGFNQSYLGPTIRFRRGEIARVSVRNALGFPITSHWHGLHVPAILDGGPQLQIMPTEVWRPELPVDQPAATLWYHSHVHGHTAEQVYAGLAGMIIVDDPSAPDAGLPSIYGQDDIPLIIQDRAFAEDGSFYHLQRGPAVMLGFRGDTMVVNGAVRPVANPPAGIVRLRLLNGSNARIYHLKFADGRTFHQVASDGGLLPKPVSLTSLVLAPAERAEILVDFSDGASVTLLSGADVNASMGMGMRRMMAGVLPGDPAPSHDGQPGEFEVVKFEPDRSRRSSVDKIPSAFPGAPIADFGEPQRVRKFSLDMHVGGTGPGQMSGGRAGGSSMGSMGINGKAHSMDRVDVAMQRGETELWEIRATEMRHPFHIHGTSFQVISNGGRETPFDTMGLKDVVLVNGKAELLVQINHRATPDIPFMFHCHILEHEDAGMMGQFTVN